MDASVILQQLAASGNLRTLPRDRVDDPGVLDFSTNDYMGLGTRRDLAAAFLSRPEVSAGRVALTSSASRLLSATQRQYDALEDTLSTLYGRPALMFNSGYHANSGLVPALCSKNTLIVADRLVHASIIDGIMLSRCEWTRFRHNDMEHLERIIADRRPDGADVIVIVESVYSMDGDTVPVEQLIEIKRRHPGLMLYIDEAHALGVVGDRGLGLAATSSDPAAWDVIVGTLGKAAASMGAYAVMSRELRELAVNRCRSLIFSTALPPLNALWSAFMLDTLVVMDAERAYLHSLGRRLADGLERITGAPRHAGHIQPLIVGDARRAVALSHALEADGLKVLPIRTPTVPPGTERLRMSLSAAMTPGDIDRLVDSISRHI